MATEDRTQPANGGAAAPPPIAAKTVASRSIASRGAAPAQATPSCATAPRHSLRARSARLAAASTSAATAATTAATSTPIATTTDRPILSRMHSAPLPVPGAQGSAQDCPPFPPRPLNVHYGGPRPTQTGHRPGSGTAAPSMPPFPPYHGPGAHSGPPPRPPPSMYLPRPNHALHPDREGKKPSGPPSMPVFYQHHLLHHQPRRPPFPFRAPFRPPPAGHAGFRGPPPRAHPLHLPYFRPHFSSLSRPPTVVPTPPLTPCLLQQNIKPALPHVTTLTIMTATTTTTSSSPTCQMDVAEMAEVMAGEVDPASAECGLGSLPPSLLASSCVSPHGTPPTEKPMDQALSADHQVLSADRCQFLLEQLAMELGHAWNKVDHGWERLSLSLIRHMVLAPRRRVTTVRASFNIKEGAVARMDAELAEKIRQAKQELCQELLDSAWPVPPSQFGPATCFESLLCAVNAATTCLSADGEDVLSSTKSAFPNLSQFTRGIRTRLQPWVNTEEEEETSEYVYGLLGNPLPCKMDAIATVPLSSCTAPPRSSSGGGRTSGRKRSASQMARSPAPCYAQTPEPDLKRRKSIAVCDGSSSMLYHELICRPRGNPALTAAVPGAPIVLCLDQGRLCVVPVLGQPPLEEEDGGGVLLENREPPVFSPSKLLRHYNEEQLLCQIHLLLAELDGSFKVENKNNVESPQEINLKRKKKNR